jgi:hypothetical protein
MNETTKRIIIAAVAAAVLIGGSVAAIAVIDDSDDDHRDGPLAMLAEEFGDEFEGRDLLEGLIERFLNDGGTTDLTDRIFDLFDALSEDLVPPSRDDFEKPDDEFAYPDPGDQRKKDRDRPGRKRPFDDERKDGKPFDRERFDSHSFEGFGFPFDPERGHFFGAPFFDGSLLEEFLEDGRITPDEAAELERFFAEGLRGEFGFGFEGFPEGFIVPEFPGFGFPFGGLPLDEFLEDGHISPDEARELERLFRESTPGGVFRFEFVPPTTDRPVPGIPEAFLEGLSTLPFREFLADGELSPEEREALREALNEWLTRLFERIEARQG